MNIDTMAIMKLLICQDNHLKGTKTALFNDISMYTNAICVEYLRQDLSIPFNFRIKVISNPNKINDELIDNILKYDNSTVNLGDYMANIKITQKQDNGIVQQKQQVYLIGLQVSLYEKGR